MAQATFKITLSETLILKIWTSVKVQVARLCPTLCDPVDYTIHGILQARIVEWVAFPFSRNTTLPLYEKKSEVLMHVTKETRPRLRLHPLVGRFWFL